MTVEKRHLITLDEILGLEYECKECGATVTVPREKWGERIQHDCPHCGIAPSRRTDWVRPESANEKMLLSLQRSIKEIIDSSDIGCNIRLEIKGDKDDKGNQLV